jgi:hypothetical protein
MEIAMNVLLWILLAVVALGGAGTAVASALGTGSASNDSIASVAATAGFQDNDLVVAVAVALAESGGNPLAYNPETAAGTPQGRGSVGLWQIYRKAHPEFDSWDLTDPQTNANAAFSVYSAAGQSFSPWSTFNNGAYISRLSDAQNRVNA